LISEARGILLTLLQENDNEGGFATSDWAEEMFQATQRLKEAAEHIDRADLF
jgi:hypothetical protein